jgi:hypothetical protein
MCIVCTLKKNLREQVKQADLNLFGKQLKLVMKCEKCEQGKKLNEFSNE